MEINYFSHENKVISLDSKENLSLEKGFDGNFKYDGKGIIQWNFPRECCQRIFVFFYENLSDNH